MKTQKMGLRSRFMLFYISFVLIILTITAGIYYASAWENVYRIVSANLLSIAEKNSYIIDQRLKLVGEYANGLTVDRDIRQVLDSYEKADDAFDRYALDRRFRDILSKYFLYCESILSVNVITKDITYGYTGEINVIPVNTFKDSQVYREAMQARGKTVWIPTYHFFNEYQQNYIKLENNIYQYVFTAAKVLREMDDDYAILVINFLENSLTHPFSDENSEYIDHYAILTPEGRVVSHSDKSQLTTRIDEDWVQQAALRGSGVMNVRIGGTEMIMAFAESKVTGWLSCIFTTQKALMAGSVVGIVRGILVLMSVLATVCICVLAFISRGFLRPLISLRKGISQSGYGKFNETVDECGIAEMRMLITSFNRMNQKIQQLIYENYQMVILKEKQKLMMYNLHVNPHFVLNSLNVVNLELLRRKQYDLSDIIGKMASIMDYTLNTQTIMVPFKVDWMHTKAYLDIMQKRYGSRFCYDCDISDDLMERLIPKFLLQPLIENSLSHGSVNQTGDIHISVRAKTTEQGILFEVEDNGKGLSPERIEQILRRESSDENRHEGGLTNIRFRIQAIYGDTYDIHIESTPYVSTTFQILLPFQSRLQEAPSAE